MIRIGNAMDIHQLVEGRKLILGGVEIEHVKGCYGHSDADALLHAIAEAILGALALGDLGKHFPDTASSTEGMDSMLILKGCVEMMKEKGYHLVNVDSTINIEKPKMAPHIQKMRENIASVCECDVDCVSVKATRGEKMGFVGHEEGVLAIASVLVEK
ncbi:2-C-methyl-D-erythritol 2,4-cyclodiphosphate synthase [uncultured Traorella sp.]|jgi:2-C-methyl-D-erythritol 2,4-cyclodiphosphate synthase|uniref:2-C-methyl-D-erythritol 2,4-cyclodiphosphate synthase n=1 Tax=uncultured Traorella sp. TaxID=1929048 RepID=UPI0025DD96AF|nr:2-C-methyl-D-erythritol 2,4-cyclodiphosphate synthase [uncultured Traorella sp.]